MRFRGRIVSRADLPGHYRLSISKTGPSGTSNIEQGGAFTAAVDGETLVGSTVVSIEPGARYEARMQVEAGGNTIMCDPLSGGNP